MKLFYIIALLLVAAMVASPFYLLKTDVVGGSLIRAYDKDGRPVIEHDPVVVHSMYGSAIKTVDPAVCGDVSSGALLGQAFEGLLSYKYLELDGTVPIVQPCLAEALPTVSEDGRVYTFKLKKGVKYHRNPCFGKLHDVEVDGKPYTVYNTHEMTAEDVILAFKRQADPYVNCTLVWPFLRQRIVGLDDWRTKVRMQYDKGDFKRYDESIKGLRAIDKYTLEITLHERFPQFVYLFAISNLAPIPREAVDYWLAGERGNPAGVTPIYDRNPEFTKAEQLVGTGPYLVEKFWPKYRYVLTRNPDFRFDPYPTKGDEQFVKAGFLDPDYTGKAMPFIDRAVFTFTAQNLPAWQLFLQGERDVSAIPREMFKKIVTPSKSLTDSWAKDGIRLIKAWDPSNAVLYFNMQDPVIGGSRSLRHALCMCFDVESYLKILLNDRGRRAQTPVPGDFRAAQDVIGRVAELREQGNYAYYYDLEGAKKKLVDAKKELAAKGLLKDGKIPPIQVEMHSGDTNETEFFRSQFERLGIDVTVTTNDFPTMQSKGQRGQFQLIVAGWHADYYDAENFLQLYYGPNAKLGMNNSRYSNPQFDALYEEIRTMPDSPLRTKKYAQMIEMLCDDCPVLMLCEYQMMVLIYDHYRNYNVMPLGAGYMKYRAIDRERKARRKKKN